MLWRRDSDDGGREKTVKRMLCALRLSMALAVVAPAAHAEVTVGLTGGLFFPADQDVTILGEDQTRSPDVGPLVGLTATAWGREWRWLGLQLDALHWRTSVTTRPTVATTKLDVDQTRTALLLSVLGRVPLGRSETFAYGGIGGGAAYTTVEHGDDGSGGALGLVGGVAIPLAGQLRLRAELRYLVTGDQGAERRGSRNSVDVSGNRQRNPARALFGPHHDTQFLPVLFGLDWAF